MPKSVQCGDYSEAIVDVIWYRNSLTRGVSGSVEWITEQLGI